MKGSNVSRAQILTSWKEIASYLGKGVRTVQRWERDMGLPVRRPNGQQNKVLAECGDLDEWLKSRWSQRPAHPENGNHCEIEERADLSAFHAAIARSRELRYENRALREQLHRQLNALFTNCGSLRNGCTPAALKMEKVAQAAVTEAAQGKSDDKSMAAPGNA